MPDQNDSDNAFDDDFEARAARFFDDQDLFDDPAPFASGRPADEPSGGPRAEDPLLPAAATPPPQHEAPAQPPAPSPPAAPPADLPVLDTAYSTGDSEIEATKRRRIRYAVITVAGLWLLVAGVMVALGVTRLRDAQGHMNGTESELSLSNLSETELPSAEAMTSALDRAHSMFGSPVVAPLKVVPILGRQIRSLDALSAAGAEAVRIGIEARGRALPVVRSAPKTGTERIEALETARDLAKEGNDKLSRLDLGPSSNLFKPIGNTRARFATELNRIGEILQRAEAGAGGMATFLSGPSKYAVFAANNSEMRAGSGMYLSAGTLDVNGGELRLGPMRSYHELPPAPNNVALEYDFLRLWGPQAPGSDYRFVNMTPRFPTSAALLQRMWAASGAPPVDGIMVIDPVAVVELLRLVGEVNVGGVTVTPSNALKLFLHDQYLQFETNKRTERRDFLADVVQRIFEQLNAGSFDSRELGKALGDAAAGRHLMAWTPTEGVQQGWNALGMDGALPDQSVMFALQNRGGNKLDYFQKVSATTHATVSRTGSKMEIDFLITNAVPNGEPAYVAGPTPNSGIAEPNIYTGIVSVNIPKNAKNVKLTGGDYDLVAGPDGNTQVVSTFLVLTQNETAKLQLTFMLPPETRALTILPSARVPSVLWHTGKLVWNDTKPQVITW